MSTEPTEGAEPLHIIFKNTPFTLYECRLACALTLYIKFEDDNPLNIDTINKVVNLYSNVENLDCTGLVEHLQATQDVYPEVEAKDDGAAQAGWAKWAREAYDKWLDPEAPPVGTWP